MEKRSFHLRDATYTMVESMSICSIGIAISADSRARRRIGVGRGGQAHRQANSAKLTDRDANGQQSPSSWSASSSSATAMQRVVCALSAAGMAARSSERVEECGEMSRSAEPRESREQLVAKV